MRKYTIILMLLGLSHYGYSQQWIDQNLGYDSMLNVVYGTAINFNGSTESLKMDIYSPKCDNPAATNPRPLLVWIHGGAFLAGSKEDPSITSLCKQFARRGYVTASINYRLGFVSDDAAWNCNYPNYSCVFASDTAEWVRALYRGIQDGKGAIRYLINRHQSLGIDTANVFVAGESAGAFVALGTALLDTITERMPQTLAIPAAPSPNANTQSCIYNLGEIFGNTIERTDLGDIDGDIEPTNITFTIKGVGNMYGAMLNDLLKQHRSDRPKPAIYSFHQPCDLVVPIDQGKVYSGLSWCFTNGYNCYGIANTPVVYGSRSISNWNIQNNYGYTIQNEFTTVNFPYNFLFGSGSCADQVNVPCHAYDNMALREKNLAIFFANLISSPAPCTIPNTTKEHTAERIQIFPNPAQTHIQVQVSDHAPLNIRLYNAVGQCIRHIEQAGPSVVIPLTGIAPGMYWLEIITADSRHFTQNITINR